MLTPLTVSAAAVTAVSANDMTFARNTLTNIQSGNTLAKFSNFSDILMTDYNRRSKMLLSPRIPVKYVNIGTAYCSLAYLNKHFAHAGFRYRNLHKCQTLGFFSLNKGIHHSFHICLQN